MSHMCDLFWQSSMDRGRGGGELVDIIGSVSGRTGAGNRWWLPTGDDPSPENFPAGSFADTFGLWGPLPNELAGTTFSDCSGGGGGGSEIQNPVNVFSRLAQISPAKHSVLSQRTNGPFPTVVDHAIQIPSQRNVGTTKGRKNQAKKVVCIPAPTAANSKTSGGEVVPSDLWAWRKYGQKPIKGSPYPRGYYRCSSSKGCSARKQVERSRSDPNMLVITYASEHNHPWPTQRNALAGSTRSSSNPNKNRKILPSTTKNSKSKAEPKDVKISSSSLPGTTVKEESTAINDGVIFGRLAFRESNDRSHDFFADLAELGSEPDEGVDPFANVFDWDGIIFGDG